SPQQKRAVPQAHMSAPKDEPAGSQTPSGLFLLLLGSHVHHSKRTIRCVEPGRNFHVQPFPSLQNSWIRHHPDHLVAVRHEDHLLRGPFGVTYVLTAFQALTDAIGAARLHMFCATTGVAYPARHGLVP